MTRIILMRHTKTVYTHEDRFVGVTDLPLSQEGVEQAREIGRKLAEEGIDRIYCSDLSRAVRTAEEIGNVVGVRPERIKELREMNFGVLDGMLKSEVMEKHRDIYQARGKDMWNFRIPGGESYRDAAERVERAIRKIAKENEGKTLLFVIHASVIKALLRSMVGWSMERIKRFRYLPGCRIYLKNENNSIEVERMEGVEHA